MEPLFENKHTLDKEFAREISFYQYFLHPLSMVTLALLIALFLFWLIMEPGSMIRHFVLIYVPLSVALRLWKYFRSVNLTVKRYNEVGQGNPVECTVQVFDDRLKMSASTGAENVLPLEQIKNSFSTKHFFMLRSKSNIAYSFRRDGFVKGDLPGMIAFLKEKGVKVK